MTSYHSRSVACELCKQQFFPSSLPFHMKQCAIKQAFVEVPCPHCDKGVCQRDLANHIERGCRKAFSRNGATPELLASCCAVCGRRFAADRLLKHQVICRRNSTRQIPKVSAVLPTSPVSSIPWRERRDEMKQQIRDQKLRATKVETDPGNAWQVEDSLESMPPTILYDSLDDEENVPPAAAWSIEWPGKPNRPTALLNLIKKPPPQSPEWPVRFSFRNV